MGLSYQGTHKLDDLIFTINKPLIGRKGVHYQKLLKDWRLIVGDDMARCTIPTKISTFKQQSSSKNILYIAASNSATLTELVYHAGVIIEQINFYFGYDYIQQLKFVQAVFPVKPNVEVPNLALSTDDEHKLTFMVGAYDKNDEIKTVLLELAANILKRK